MALRNLTAATFLVIVCMAMVLIIYTHLAWRVQSLEGRVSELSSALSSQGVGGNTRLAIAGRPSPYLGHTRQRLHRGHHREQLHAEQHEADAEGQAHDTRDTHADTEEGAGSESSSSGGSEGTLQDTAVPQATPRPGRAHRYRSGGGKAQLPSFLGGTGGDALAMFDEPTQALLQQFGVLSPTAYREKQRRTAPTTRVHRQGSEAQPHYYYAYLDDPSRFRLLLDAEWGPGGKLKKPKRQSHPKFNKKRDERYFEGYTYPKRHMCPGEPYECSAHGVCDYTRGVCTCHPPWTGWQCHLKMRAPAAGAPMYPTENEFTQDDCVDQHISAPAAEKWDERTEKRCRGMDDRNGMWLGLTKKMTKTIAHSIAETLGVEEGHKVLDIGMGCGTISEGIKEAVDIRMYGLDYSQAAVHYVRENNKGTFCVADVRQLGFIPDASVDFAFENGVFSVTRDGHCETYKNVVRVLKPGGTLLILQTYTDWHKVRCWQNIRMQSVEGCLADLGLRMDYILTRDLTRGKYDSYCAGETYAFFLRKPLNS